MSLLLPAGEIGELVPHFLHVRLRVAGLFQRKQRVDIRHHAILHLYPTWFDQPLSGLIDKAVAIGFPVKGDVTRLLPKDVVYLGENRGVVFHRIKHMNDDTLRGSLEAVVGLGVFQQPSPGGKILGQMLQLLLYSLTGLELLEIILGLQQDIVKVTQRCNIVLRGEGTGVVTVAVPAANHSIVDCKSPGRLYAGAWKGLDSRRL